MAEAQLSEDDQAPTAQTYGDLQRAFEHFNETLFGGELGRCLITFQRKANSHGYFHSKQFEQRAGDDAIHEIALNPQSFGRTIEEVLGTLVHEMVHHWQDQCGKPSRSGYHNAEWARKMDEVGLVPSSSGAPGGKRTGQHMTHYIEAGGPFERACKALLDSGYYFEWRDRASEARKAATRTKYVCPDCGAAAWGKPDLHIRCDDCNMNMNAA